nr:lysozyme inhibitor LprI family protein [Massilia aquatica]
MADKHECIAKLAKSSALALEKAEAKAAAAIARPDGKARNVKQARARLKASSAAFSAYRVDQCAFAMATIGGGAGDARDTTRLTCLARKNLQRAQELARETDTVSSE